MANQGPYEQWLGKRKSVHVPEGFTHRVMAAIHLEDRRQRVPWWERSGAGPVVQIGLAAAAVVAFALRFAVLFTAAVG